LESLIEEEQEVEQESAEEEELEAEPEAEEAAEEAEAAEETQGDDYEAIDQQDEAEHNVHPDAPLPEEAAPPTPTADADADADAQAEESDPTPALTEAEQDAAEQREAELFAEAQESDQVLERQSPSLSEEVSLAREVEHIIDDVPNPPRYSKEELTLDTGANDDW